MSRLDEAVQSTGSGKDRFIADYRGYLAVKILAVVGILVALLLVTGYAITISGKDVGFLETYGYIWNHITGVTYEFRSPEWFVDYSIFDIRMPRILAAILAGFGLSVCGCVMQAVTRNPLADPYTTGMSSGAVFGVSIGMVFGFSLNSTFGDMGIMFNAFVFGLIPAVFIIAVSAGKTRSPATIVLGGIAISYLFSSLSTIAMMYASEQTIRKAYLWQLGLWSVSRQTCCRSCS